MTEFKKIIKIDTAKMDYTELLKLERRYAKNKPEMKNAPSLRVAILGSKNTQFFTKIFKVFLIHENIDPILFEGEYNSIAHEILFKNSALFAFNPDILILLPNTSDLTDFPSILDHDQKVDELVETTASYYVHLWDKVLSQMSCTILQANFVIDLESSLDQMEINVGYSRTVFLMKLNLALLKHKPKQVHLIDENSLAAEVGKRVWFDPISALLNKAPYAYSALPMVVSAYVRKILSLRGLYRKALVLDLDNTLWGGVIGDDGVKGINLDPNHALGEAFLAFQKTILRLKEKGVLLAVCSKNNEEMAKLGFTHPNMLIKLKDIACFVANWQDKASNLSVIADALNVKTDALVFFDDNPAEREIVKSYRPEVMVVDVPADPAYYCLALYDAHPFDWAQITHEDILRNRAIEDDVQRDSVKAQFVDYDAYLQSLEMKAVAGLMDDHQIERFVQLTNKSNQFNLRTQRYTEADIIALKKDPTASLITIDLSDRFSPYGIIACVILKKQKDVAFIENWVMSCRVLNRGIEELTLDLCVKFAQTMNCIALVGEYIPTAKNGLVKELYRTIGFVQSGENHYRLDLKDYQPKPCIITLKENS